MNVVGTKQIIELSKRLARLDALIHVSTAYANCERRHQDEVVYAPPMQPDEVIAYASGITDEFAERATPLLIHPRPNTYTFTKAIAETLVAREARLARLPCAIVRPSIVGAAWREPLAGWIDNLNGVTGILVGTGKGVLRAIKCDPNYTLDLVPVDISVFHR